MGDASITEVSDPELRENMRDGRTPPPPPTLSVVILSVRVWDFSLSLSLCFGCYAFFAFLVFYIRIFYSLVFKTEPGRSGEQYLSQGHYQAIYQQARKGLFTL